jgi:hypothetical protein
MVMRFKKKRKWRENFDKQWVGGSKSRAMDCLKISKKNLKETGMLFEESLRRNIFLDGKISLIAQVAQPETFITFFLMCLKILHNVFTLPSIFACWTRQLIIK